MPRPGHDPIDDDPNQGADQRAHFTASKDVTLVSLPGTGHVLPLELTAGLFQAAVAGWLSLHGF